MIRSMFADQPCLEVTTTSGVLCRRLETLTPTTSPPSCSFHHLVSSLYSSCGFAAVEIPSNQCVRQFEAFTRFLSLDASVNRLGHTRLVQHSILQVARDQLSDHLLRLPNHQDDFHLLFHFIALTTSVSSSAMAHHRSPWCNNRDFLPEVCTGYRVCAWT